jgi:hypothetical protein
MSNKMRPDVPRVDVMDTQSLLNYSDKINDPTMKITRTLSRNFQTSASTNLPSASVNVPPPKTAASTEIFVLQHW